MRHQAIILKKIPVGEHDELIMCYTRYAGKQKFRAKSSVLARSKQGSHLDVLRMVEFSLIEGRHHMFPIIASAVCVKPYGALRTSLPALATSFFLLEAFDKLVYEDEEDEPLWNFLTKRLEFFNAHAHEPMSFWNDEVVRVHEELLVCLGYGDQTNLLDLTPKAFYSLQFFSKMK